MPPHPPPKGTPRLFTHLPPIPRSAHVPFSAFSPPGSSGIHRLLIACNAHARLEAESAPRSPHNEVSRNVFLSNIQLSLLSRYRRSYPPTSQKWPLKIERSAQEGENPMFMLVLGSARDKNKQKSCTLSLIVTLLSSKGLSCGSNHLFL